MIEPTNPLRFAGDLAYEKGADLSPQEVNNLRNSLRVHARSTRGDQQTVVFRATVAQRDPYYWRVPIGMNDRHRGLRVDNRRAPQRSDIESDNDHQKDQRV